MAHTAADRIPDPADDEVDASYVLNAAFVRRVCDALDAGDATLVKALVEELHAADLADLLEIIRPDEREHLVELLGADLDPDVLPELEAGILDEVVEAMEPGQLAAAVRELDSDDAVHVLEDMEPETRDEILATIPAEERAAVQRSLDYPEDTAGRLMQTELVAVPSFWNVGQIIDDMREKADDLPHAFYEIMVIDPSYHPVGTVALAKLLRTKRPVPVADIMNDEPVLVPAAMESPDLARLFEKYNLVSAPVVDAAGRLIGQLTIDDIVEIVREEAQEDMMALSGVSEESISDGVIPTAWRRFSWLGVNLLTAILASAVIGLFEAQISQVVALAILMPIVASMGGNAGTQTLAVVVRALATREISGLNAWRTVTKEVLMGLINGVAFALIVGVVAAVWFQTAKIGVVIGAAMIINLAAAALAGILIPLGLQRMKVDPAVSSTVFVTTVTDCVGFFAFLGLAAVILF